MATLTRREVLAAGLAIGGTAASALAPWPARAATAPSARRFLFIYASGGWDPLCAFATHLEGPEVQAEPEATVAMAGSIPYVSHPRRPSVDRFFEQHHQSLAVVNGLHVPSVSHAVALRLMTTGNVSAAGGDWATRIAAAQAEDFLVPHLLVGGPGFFGEMGMFVARASTSSQLADLSSGQILLNSDLAVGMPAPTDSNAVDAWLAEQNQSRAQETAAQAQLVQGYGSSLERAEQLGALGAELSLSGGEAFTDQLRLGVDALALGLSRSVTLNHPERSALTRWDSHSNSHMQQSELFEDLFAHLLTLAQTLATTPGVQAPTLAEEVVVVVLSEMGRTPLLNSAGGKDHWPYTSALLFGPGVRGGQVLGGFDAGLVGQKLDPESGAVHSDGILAGQDTLGATLMELAGADPFDAGYQGPLLSALID
jgi:uncharacterized protein (DUF1501 family)